MGVIKFNLGKLKHEGAPLLRYTLGGVELNPLLGQEIRLAFTGRISCVACGRNIKKTFAQGHCYPCFQKLAACDSCIMKPELCHFAKGTCREPDWAASHCFIPHIVYLANTTGLKVGITREHQKLTRWGDQGAVAAMALCRVPERKLAGLIERQLAEVVSDRTDWRALITGRGESYDLAAEALRVLEALGSEFEDFRLSGEELFRFEYPVNKYPEKAVTIDLEKEPRINGSLDGIRGQYLFISGRAINIWKFSGYEVEWGVG